LKNFRIIHLDKKGNMGDANTRSTIGDHWSTALRLGGYIGHGGKNGCAG
jgi:hypothetical protein